MSDTNNTSPLPSACRLYDAGHAYVPDRWLFRHLNLNVAPGEVFALLGANGCGKTTLLNVLTGALMPNEGKVVCPHKIAFVPQLFNVAFDYTVLDIVLMGRAAHIGLFAQPNADDKAAAHAALSRFGLADCAKRPFAELSGGQRQLAIFARALVAQAKFLMLDEPTAALDFRNQELVLRWIHKLAKQDGLTVLFATHSPQHVLAVADRALLMFDGAETVCGLVDEVLSEARLLRLYGMPLKRVSFTFDGKTLETLAPIFDVSLLPPVAMLANHPISPQTDE